jgi:hypothetical protein
VRVLQPDKPSPASPLEASPRPRDARPRSRKLTVRELLAAWLGLAVVGVVAYAPHIRNGGFYLDDWSNAAGTLYPPGGHGFSHAISYFSELTLYRPVLVLYVPLTYLILGTHMAYQLAWSAFLGIFVAAMLYGVLRSLAVPRSHSWIIAVLTIVYPWYDSTRLWETADQATVSISFALAGLWVAISGLNRRSLARHACAAVLYLLSILSYEVTLPVIAAFGGIYVLCIGWRAARNRWAIDVVVVVIGALWVGLQTNHESYGLSADLTHLREIVTSGGTILGRSLLPLGSQRTTLAICALALVVAVGLGVQLSSRARPLSAIGWSLASWLRLAGAGLLVAVLGWVIFIPADPYYTPSVYGVTNRVNAVAGIGLVMVVYAALGILGALASSLRPRAHMLAGLTLVLGVVLGAGYAKVLERHSTIWNAAYSAEAAGIGEMRMQLPVLAPGSTVFVTDYPAYQTLGVPIFSASWDVNGMIKLQYKDATLQAYPLLPGLSISCRADGLGLSGAGTGPSGATAAYGKAWLLDVHTGRHIRPDSQRNCAAAVPHYPAGPLYLSSSY